MSTGRALVALTGAVALCALTAVPALADDEQVNLNRYSLTAEGNGMYYQLDDNGLPATTTVSASPWAAHAEIDSQSKSIAFAGLPYLGAFAQTLPGTVNGLSGGALPPIPPVPGYVTSRYPSVETDSQSQGPYLITATSAPTSSQASAGTGVSADAADPQPQVHSAASVVANPDGTVSSVASAGVEAVRMGPLTILQFGTREALTEDGKGTLKQASQTDLGTLEVAGMRFGVDQNGFNAAGGTTPLPTATFFDQVNSALGAAGIKLDFIPRSVTRDAESGVTTVTSGALRVTMVQDVPTQGPVSVSYTFGRSVVATSDVGEEVVALPETPVDAPATDGGTALPPVVDAPAVPVTSPVTPMTDVAPPVVTGGAPEAPSVSSPTTPRTTLGFLPRRTGQSNGNSLVYLVLALAGAAVLGAQQVFSRFGIMLLLRT